MKSICSASAIWERCCKDWRACEPSRFLDEIPASELVYARAHKEAVATVSQSEGLDRLAKIKALLNRGA